MFWPHIPPDKMPPLLIKKYEVEEVDKIDEKADLEDHELKEQMDFDKPEEEFENVIKELDKQEEQAAEANKASYKYPPVEEIEEPSDCVLGIG